LDSCPAVCYPAGTGAVATAVGVAKKRLRSNRYSDLQRSGAFCSVKVAESPSSEGGLSGLPRQKTKKWTIEFSAERCSASVRLPNTEHLVTSVLQNRTGDQSSLLHGLPQAMKERWPLLDFLTQFTYSVRTLLRCLYILIITLVGKSWSRWRKEQSRLMMTSPLVR
jgi:hypothetical protein